MNNNFNLNPSQVDLLLNLAGQRMGTDPQKLKAQMESGQMDSILKGLSPTQQAQINNLMSSPAAIEQFMTNPKVQQLIKGLMGK